MDPFLALTTPTNLDAERDKFFASSSYHPVFTYDWDKPVMSKHPLKNKLLQAVIKQDRHQIVSLAKRLFEVTPTDAIHRQADEVVSLRHEYAGHGTARDFADLLTDAFTRFQIPYTVVITTQSGFNARPDHSNRRIIVSEHIHFEMFSMQGGVRHDLVHIIRKLNGLHNQIKNDPEYLPSEEGLASYCQDHVHGIEDNGQVQHALEYLGTEVGLSGSLRDIYELMREHGMSEELAWKRASRHKFGFIDTREPGDIVKPAMYFTHELKVTSLTTDERLRLFVGKISLKNLSSYTSYRGRYHADELVEYFNL